VRDAERLAAFKIKDEMRIRALEGELARMRASKAALLKKIRVVLFFSALTRQDETRMVRDADRKFSRLFGRAEAQRRKILDLEAKLRASRRSDTPRVATPLCECAVEGGGGGWVAKASARLAARSEAQRQRAALGEELARELARSVAALEEEKDAAQVGPFRPAGV
jgi:hypothetical protein